MTPSRVRSRVVADRILWIGRMLDEIRALPAGSEAAFLSDRRNVWAAESCLRRALEALLDLGRHVLAKGFGEGVTEYKQIAERLRDLGVLGAGDAETLRLLAGYRNRMVHFYHEISPGELRVLCADRLGDVERVRDALAAWCRDHPERVTEEL